LPGFQPQLTADTIVRPLTWWRS